MRNILAIGAYDRDNFGDYLFLELLRRALPEDNIIAGSYIYATIPEYKLATLPYEFVLRNYTVDAVWVVGGEVGGVNINNALAMSLRDEMSASRKYIEKLAGVPTKKYKFAYLPDISVYNEDKSTPLIINSVGLSHAPLTPYAEKILQQAVFSSVRDNASYSLVSSKLASTPPPVRVAPDAVHTLSLYYEPSPASREHRYIIFQANRDYIDRHSVKAITQVLSELYQNTKLEVILLAAGTAFGHDDLNKLKRIHANLSKLSVQSSVFVNRDPLKIVDLISNATLAIGTSLHVRVVAESYGVSRISLENQKVGRYVASWDNSFPYNIPLADIPYTVDQMTFSKNTSKLRLLSQKNLVAAKKAMVENSRSSSKPLYSVEIERDFLRLTFGLSNKQIYELNKTVSRLESSIASLESSLTDMQNTIHDREYRLSTIEGSRLYKLFLIAKKITRR